MYDTNNTCEHRYNGMLCGGKLQFVCKVSDLDRTTYYRCQKCNEITELI